MINNISEGAMRVATKIDPSAVVHDQEATQQKANEIRESRPVEQTEASGQAKAKTETKEDSSSKFLFNGKHVVFEKYNKDGDVILRIPPSDSPVDQMA